MKAKVVQKQTVKPFEPVTVVVTFESEGDLSTTEGFVFRFDQCARHGTDSGNWMSIDNTCKAIRDALREAGR